MQPPSAPNGMVHSNGRYGDAYPATPPPADGSRKRKTKGEASAADLMAPQMQLLLRLTSYLETTQSDFPNGNKDLPSRWAFQEMMRRACLKLLGSAPGASGSTHDVAPLKHARFTNNGGGTKTMHFKCALISPRATGALGDALTRPARRCPWRRNLRARRPAEEGAVPSVLFPVEGHASLRDDLFVMIHPCSVSRCSGTEHGARRVFFLQRDVPTRYGHRSHRHSYTHYLTTTHSAPLRLWCGNFSWNLRTPSIHRKTSVDGVGHHASDALSVHGEAELREELDRGDKEAPCVRGEHAALVELGAAALLEGDRRDVRTPPARAGSCAPRQRTGRACSRPTESRSARQPSPWKSP